MSQYKFGFQYFHCIVICQPLCTCRCVFMGKARLKFVLFASQAKANELQCYMASSGEMHVDLRIISFYNNSQRKGKLNEKRNEWKKEKKNTGTDGYLEMRKTMGNVILTTVNAFLLSSFTCRGLCCMRILLSSICILFGLAVVFPALRTRTCFISPERKDLH